MVLAAGSERERVSSRRLFVSGGSDGPLAHHQATTDETGEDVGDAETAMIDVVFGAGLFIGRIDEDGKPYCRLCAFLRVQRDGCVQHWQIGPPLREPLRCAICGEVVRP